MDLPWDDLPEDSKETYDSLSPIRKYHAGKMMTAAMHFTGAWHIEQVEEAIDQLQHETANEVVFRITQGIM